MWFWIESSNYVNIVFYGVVCTSENNLEIASRNY